ncbi:heavy-metal-associated domain-containing protein [Albidovulum sp.]
MTRLLTLNVQNMSCAACAERVDRALRALPGIRDVAVDLAAGTARIGYDAPAEPAIIAEALAKAGYPAAEAETVLAVEGMHCAACAGHVKRALGAVPGVTAAEVDLATGSARIRHLAGAAGPAEFAAAVRAEGYEARP